MLRTQNVCLLAGSFAEAGFFPVIDHVVADREMLEAMLGWLQGRPVWFVTLAPDLSTAQARNETRPEHERIDYDISGLYADIQRELSAKGWWFDTSTVSAEDAAQKIIAEAADRAVVAGDR